MSSSSAAPSNDGRGRTKVLIIGAGAAGMSCAATLAREPDKFDVTVLERDNEPGGQATAISIDGKKFGADWINNGASIGAKTFRHTFKFFREYGYEPKEIKLQYSFEKGKDRFWNSMFPSPAREKYAPEIQRFEQALRKIRQFPVLWPVPMKAFLRMFKFSEDFGSSIIYPVASVFFGLGGSGHTLPCGIFQILFEDPTMRFWDYDTESFIPDNATGYAFPNMSRFYRDWAAGLCSKGVKIRYNTQALNIIQRKKNRITVETRQMDADQRITEQGFTERNISGPFDKLVFCIPLDNAKRLLGKLATWREKCVLGRGRWIDDLSVVHYDDNYINKRYECKFRDELCAAPKTKQDEDRIKFAKGESGPRSGFRPSICSSSYQLGTGGTEVFHDCTQLQYQFNLNGGISNIEHHIFQNHFADETSRHMWTVDLIDPKKIIETKWWHMSVPRWQNFVDQAPCLRFLNGKHDTYYAGGNTFLNTHEVAIITGMTAAYRMGAKYEKIDDLADGIFAFILSFTHGKRLAAGRGI